MAEAVRRYRDEMDSEHRPVFDRLHQLIVASRVTRQRGPDDRDRRGPPLPRLGLVPSGRCARPGRRLSLPPASPPGPGPRGHGQWAPGRRRRRIGRCPPAQRSGHRRRAAESGRRGTPWQRPVRRARHRSRCGVSWPTRPPDGRCRSRTTRRVMILRDGLGLTQLASPPRQRIVRRTWTARPAGPRALLAQGADRLLRARTLPASGCLPARHGRTRDVIPQRGRTFSACGPFCPWVVSNSTFWFSSSDL